MALRMPLSHLILVPAWLLQLGLCASESANQEEAGRGAPERFNILLIAVDDLNDWVSCLQGHPQARTPNIDRLASRGVLFANAHCQSPVCNPSRSSLLTSLHPSSSGIYFLNPDITQSPVAGEITTLPQRFAEEGYYVAGAGKIFHGGQNQRFFPNYAGDFGGFGPVPETKLSGFPGHPLWDWGKYPQRDELMPDVQIADWGAARLNDKLQQPFFLATGFYRPHVPQYAPEKWFRFFAENPVQLPATQSDDLDDLSEYSVNLTRLQHVAPSHQWVTENGQWQPLVQSYLACVSFVDAQIGRLIAALESSPYADSTYVVLFSDHGFHLGEKQRWAKRSLWEESTRVPLIIAGPAVAEGKICHRPVELLDLYPTLLELTGRRADPKLEGQSLLPLLQDPKADWPHLARTSFGPGNVAVRSERYRFIRYNDGSEEFYDHDADPHEWRNLIGEPSCAEAIERHRSQLPRQSHPILGAGSTGHKAYAAAEARR